MTKSLLTVNTIVSPSSGELLLKTAVNFGISSSRIVIVFTELVYEIALAVISTVLSPSRTELLTVLRLKITED